MAIVLPQGRLNNTNDLFIRNFLFSKAHTGVVGLHPNTDTQAKKRALFSCRSTSEQLAHTRGAEPPRGGNGIVTFRT